MLVKSVNKSVKDVFLGSGWNSWVRVDLNSKRVLHATVKVSDSLAKTIFGKVHK